MRKFLMTGASFAALLAGMAGSAHAGLFTYDGTASQTFTAPASGTYDITAAGAQGGPGDYYLNFSAPSGGLGATVGGDVYLTADTILDIVVGGQGGIGFGGGGGGGSFVFYPSASSPLVVAGGGGGGAHYSYGGAGQAGTAGQAAITSAACYGYVGPGGVKGSGGAGGFGGGGGGGWSGAGGQATGDFVDGYGSGGSGPPGFAGGKGWGAANGGFGGGGGGGVDDGGGGGGGFSGGGGGAEHCGGGGGGSYLAPGFTDTKMTAGDNSGNGYVTIDPVSSVSSVPEPGTLGLFASALAGLALIGRRRRRS